MTERLNEDVAGRLDEVARLFEAQGANPFRVRAYRRAAETLRHLDEPVDQILKTRGLEGLEALPTIGESLARAVRDILVHGRLAMLERLRGEADPIKLLGSVPGVGPVLADHLHHELNIDTLEELELAAHDGRLERLAGIGPKRLAGIRDTLAHRLSRVRSPHAGEAIPLPRISELLDVDEEYRKAADAGMLRRIAPRRFNPSGNAWLPILHTARGRRHYTAMFSNTARAHRLGKTHDWVTLYFDEDQSERQCTVITSEYGSLKGLRIVRGREQECAEYYRAIAVPAAR